MKYPGCKKCVSVAIPILFFGNLILAATKITIGILGKSTGLIADGAHSATDAVSAAILYFGLKFAEKPADDEHPYGHNNIEFIIAKIVSILLLLVGLYILFSSSYKMYMGHYVVPDYVTLATALLSVVANIIMYRYGYCVATQLNSPAILSVSLEIKADAMSSVAIAIGIICAEMGYPFLDPVAACIISLFIIKNSIHMLTAALDGLMDASIGSKLKRKISIIIKKNPDVSGIGFLRSRRVGRFISLEIGIKIDAKMTVEEGNDIAKDLRSDLMNLVENVGEVEITISSAKPELNDEADLAEDLDWEMGAI